MRSPSLRNIRKYRESRKGLRDAPARRGLVGKQIVSGAAPDLKVTRRGAAIAASPTRPSPVDPVEKQPIVAYSHIG
jgi:hypothetical protein